MPQQFDTDRPTWDEIRAVRQPRTSSVWVPLDNDLLAQIAALERAVTTAEKIDETEHRIPEAPKLRDRLDALRSQAEAAAVQFSFAEIPRRRFRAIVDACPPADPAWRWDEDRFAPLLLAATCAAPELTSGITRADLVERLVPGVAYDDIAELIAPAVELWDDWSEAACYMLYGVAHEVNAQAATVPFSVTATARTPASHPSSTSASATDEA